MMTQTLYYVYGNQNSGREKMTKAEWLKKWDFLHEIERKFILTICPEVLNRDLTKTKSPARILNVAWIRGKNSGLLKYKTCSRCGGSGEYSFNRTHGSKCFKCEGKGEVLPYLTEKLITEIKKKIGDKK
jgi:hypothetical protein